MENNTINDLVASTDTMVLLHSDPAKMSSNDKQEVEQKSEARGLYGKECHFYEFYFLAVADHG